MSAPPLPRGRFFVSIFLDMMTVAMVVPLLASICRQLGLSRSLVGLIQSIYGLCQLVSTPLMGTLSDRIGRKPVLMLSVIGTAVSFAVLAVALHLQSQGILVLARVIMGGLRQTVSVGAALVSEAYARGMSDGEQRRKATGAGFSRLAFSTSSAFVVGPALGGWLAESFGLIIVSVVAFLLASLNSGLMYKSIGSGWTTSFLKKPNESRSNPLRLAWRIMLGKPPTNVLLVVLFAFSFSFVMTQSTISLVLPELHRQPGAPDGAVSLSTTGMVIGLASGLSSAAQLAVPSLFRRFSSAGVSGVVLVLATVGLAIQSMAATPQSYAYAVFGVAVCSGIADTVNKSIFAATFNGENAGEVMSIVYSIDGVNRAIAPLLGGFLMDYVGPTAPSCMSCCSSLVAAALFCACVRPHLPSESEDHRKKTE